MEFFTVFDGDMEKYFQDFADKTGFFFDDLFPRVVGGPPTVEKNAQAFYQWGAGQQLSADPGFTAPIQACRFKDIRGPAGRSRKSPLATAR